jgi:hypothetical protein
MSDERTVEHAYRHGYHAFKAYMYESLYEGFSPSIYSDDLTYAAIDVAIRSGDEIKDDRYIEVEIEYQQEGKWVNAGKFTVVVSHELRVQIVGHGRNKTT